MSPWNRFQNICEIHYIAYIYKQLLYVFMFNICHLEGKNKNKLRMFCSFNTLKCLNIKFFSFWTLWVLLPCPSTSSNRCVSLGLILLSVSGTDTAETLLTYQSSTKHGHELVSDFYHHLCLFPSPEKAGFLPCCFSVIAKDPEGWNPAVVCVITSERDQWCYIPVISQIH